MDVLSAASLSLPPTATRPQSNQQFAQEQPGHDHDPDQFAGSVETSDIPDRRAMQAAAGSPQTAAANPLARRPQPAPDPNKPAKDAAVGRMVDRGMNIRALSPELKKKVQDELSVVPLDVLKTVERNNTKIVVMRDGQTPRDVGVIEPLDTKKAFADTAALKGIADKAFASADAKYGKQITDLEAKVAAERVKARKRQEGQPQQPLGMAGIMGAGMGQPYDPTSSDPEVMKLTSELAKAKTARDREAYTAIDKQTDGRVGPYMVPGAGGGGMLGNIGAALQNMPATVESIAAVHGARTPAEVKEFSEKLRALNGDRLTRAQEDFKKTFGANAPAALKQTWDKTPPDHRPFMAGQSDIVVPEMYWHRNNPENAAEKPMAMNRHDYGSMLNWSAGTTAGQYWYQGDKNTIVLHEKDLGKNRDGHSVPVHELGHAYEDAVSQLDPKAFEQFEKERNDTYERLGKSTTPKFPTHYAETNPVEFVAESFASRYSSDPGELGRLDPQWSGTFDRFLGEATRLGGQR